MIMIDCSILIINNHLVLINKSNIIILFIKYYIQNNLDVNIIISKSSINKN